jgi:hypothetical protein
MAFPWHTECLNDLGSTSATDASELEMSMEAEQTQHDWADKARDTFDDARATVETWDERVKQFAREKPLAALFCAVVGGYTLARVSSWWR